MKPKTKIVQHKTKEKVQKRKIYDEDNLKRALDAVHGGMSKKLAAKQFQVPRSTIQFRINNQDKVNPRPGPPTVLTHDEEKLLVNWIIESGRKGFPKRKEDLQHSVARFLKDTNRPNTFKNSTPGEKWLKLFLQRHPEITTRTPEAVTTASSLVAEKDIRKWFDGIELYLKENQLFEVVSDPSRGLNGDETNFLLCPKTGTVLAARGEKNVYEVDQGIAKTAITVMFTFTASGDTTPPMVIFPYKRLPSEIAAKVPSDWGIGLSENGWMKADLFHDYIKNVLHPHLVKEGKVFPVILFVDGHKTHLTLQVSELCSELQIVLLALYPNSTRILQPADVSAFYPLKCSWRKSVLDWRRAHPSQALTKLEFVPILKEAIDKSVSPDTIKNGFRACGLYPWDSNALNYSKCLGSSTSQTSQDLFYSAALGNTNKHSESPIITEEKFMEIVGFDTINFLEESKNLTDRDILLRKLWDCFRNVSTPSDQTKASLNRSRLDIQEIISNSKEEKEKEKEDDTQKLQISDKSELVSERPEPKTYLDQSCVVTGEINIENLDVVIADNDESAFTLPISHEVLIHENSNNDCKPESIQTACNDISDNTLQIIENSLVNVIVPNQTDFDEITAMPENEELIIDHQVQKTPVKLNLNPVQLHDILVLPKTPKRKGTKNTEKVTFVLTSAEWQKRENAKKREKEFKEEQIRKRKEERELKKLNTKPKQPTKKTLQKNKTNTEKENQERKGKLSEIRELLFSDSFYNNNSASTSKLHTEVEGNNIDLRIMGNSSRIHKKYSESEIEEMLTED